MQQPKRIITQWFEAAGVRIDGADPWDIQVRDERFYTRVLRDGSLGLGESYMAGWWDCPRIDAFIDRLLRASLEDKAKGSPGTLAAYMVARLFNRQSVSRAEIIARRHYNLGNDLFFAFLDSRNQYSCGYFAGTVDLEEAQLRKLELIGRKLALRPGDHLLDIGCGWGGLARFAAERYGCTVTAVTIAEEQSRFAEAYCRGLPVAVRRLDYRQIEGSFDKVVSVGMFEHVGQKNYRTFMEKVHRVLKEGGIFLLHTIGSNVSRFHCEPWINRYIFPNGMLPSIAQIGRAVEGLFVVEDLHNLGSHYEKTLLAWNDRFQKAWSALAARYDAVFKRMWEYYLLSCAGVFRARQIQVWQIVLTGTGRAQPRCRFE